VEQIIPKVPAEKVDLAVLPEYAYLSSPEMALKAPNGPRELARKTSSPVVFGAVEGTYATAFSNVAAVIGSDGELLGTFPKQRPVPLMADGVPGNRRPVFEVGDDQVLGVGICYDFDAPAVAGSLVGSGATVLVAPTMDRMNWTRMQHDHHALLFRLRAVENDRWLLRATSSGRTEVIDPHGKPSKKGIPVGAVDGHIVLPFAHRHSWALGGRLAWLGPAAALGTLLFLGWWARERLRARWRRLEPAGGAAAASKPGGLL
jgi:apolipoprotein N-acyltransferase